MSNNHEQSEKMVIDQVDDNNMPKTPEDEDDDLPLAELAKKIALANFRAKQAEKRKLEKAIASKAARKRVKQESHEAESKAEQSSSSSENDDSEPEKDTKKRKQRQSGGRRGPSVSTSKGNYCEFYESEKGRLVQSLLCRWHYAIDWPEPPATVPPKPGYEPLEGDLLANVWVCTGPDEMGSIIDLRHQSEDHESYCPCLANLSRLKSEKLRMILNRAYDNQIGALRGKCKSEHDNEDDDIRKYGRLTASLIQTLLSEKRWCNAVDVDAADNFCQANFSNMIEKFAMNSPINMPGTSSKTVLQWSNVKLKHL